MKVLLTDHEYGAVVRIWQRACERVGSQRHPPARLPLPFTTAEETVDALFSQVTHGTRLIRGQSHITSPTAVILPSPEICRRARERGIAVCIDGPHAPAQIPLDISASAATTMRRAATSGSQLRSARAFLYVAKETSAPHPPAGSLLGPPPAAAHRETERRVLLERHARFLAVPCHPRRHPVPAKRRPRFFQTGAHARPNMPGTGSSN